MQPQDEVEGTSPQAGKPAAAGSVAAFEEAYLRYAPRLRKIATGKFGIMPADADALVHDVFATYLMHAATVRNLEPYLIGAICNASRYHLRRSSAANILFCGETPCAATPDDALSNEIERKLLVSRMLARVGSRCRDLLYRYYMGGETADAIAARIGATPGSVAVFLSNCRKRMREAYRSMTEKN
jgi:RNA polymerase sigma factor (sigma-70 family)